MPQETEQDQLRAYLHWLDDHPLPVPTEGQARWLEAEVGMFVHFGVNTYANMEWSDGTLSPEIFNPSRLDCDQWVRVAESFGARYMILTAKHHDGFCLWPTETTDYSVKSSPFQGGKGDVVGGFLAACKRAGMAAGLYLSPWDRHEPCYSDKEAYDKFYTRQLTELCTWYDIELFELWFDGAGSVGREYDWDAIMGVCQRYQPQAMIFNMGRPTIRWIGNEWGIAPNPNWNAFQMGKDFRDMAQEDIEGIGLLLKDVNGLGNHFLPGECDVPLRNGWFYSDEPGAWYKDAEMMFDIYRKSVGRGANLLLNIAPNRAGRIQENEVEIARELGKLVQKNYLDPIATAQGSGMEILLELESTSLVNRVILQEDIRLGQRVRGWKMEGETGPSQWKSLCQGSSIGHKRIKHFAPTEVSKLRLRVTESLAPPEIRSFAAFVSNTK